MLARRRFGNPGPKRRGCRTLRHITARSKFSCMSGWPLSNEAGTRRCRIDVTGPTEDVEAVFVEFEEPSVEPVYREDIALRKSIIPGEAQSSPQFSNPAPGNSLAAALWRQS